MKNFLGKQYLFKECKKCPVKTKKQEVDTIISPCQNCIELGKAVPPPSINVKIEYNK